ncbi:uncharacterized protein BDR25DRAFT_376872, partial [Lindgomyces ingoldianus]
HSSYTKAEICCWEACPTVGFAGRHFSGGGHGPLSGYMDSQFTTSSPSMW